MRLKKIRNMVKKVGVFCTAMALMVVPAFADATTPTSMLNAETTAIINDFAADLPVTVLALIAILIPVSLTLWAIGFAIKKGLRFLQKKAASAL